MGTCGVEAKPSKKNKINLNDNSEEIQKGNKKHLKSNKNNNKIDKDKNMNKQNIDEKLIEKPIEKNEKKYNINPQTEKNIFSFDETTKPEKTILHEINVNNTKENDIDNHPKNNEQKDIASITKISETKNEIIIRKYKDILTLEGHTEKVASLTQLKSGKLVSGSYDNTLRIWDINDPAKYGPENTIKEQGYVLFILEFEKNKILVGNSNNQINLWNLNNDPINLEYTFEAHELWINCLVIIDEKTFASASNDVKIIIWDYYNRKIISVLEGHFDCILTLIKLKNGKLCSGSADQTINIWDIKSNSCIQTLKGHKRWIKCLLELNNDMIISGSDDKTIKIWNYNTQENKYELFKTLSGHNHSVRTFCQIDDNHFASGSFDCSIKIWDINSWNCVETWIGHDSIIIWMIIINYDGKKIIASCSDDKTIKLWDKCVVDENKNNVNVEEGDN